jgi:peptidoglycan/xylan/chitin deacetylase (PgdA/CDA1 family)
MLGHAHRATAGVLILMAVASVVRAAGERDAPPLQAHPGIDTVAQRVAALRGRVPDRPPAPGPETVDGIPLGRQPVRLPILMYHYIRVNPDPRDQLGFNLSVTPDDFNQQIDWLARNGYHPVDFDDLRAYLAGQDSLPSRPVILTFDDGYRDMYTTAFPILRAHRFKAVAYIVSGFLNAPNNVTADQVLEMDANGVQIGAHTVSHADLTRQSPADLHHEVFDSRATLEALVGHPVLDFCYPSGRFDGAVVQTVQAAGFETATTTQAGIGHSAGDRFTWPRVRISGGESLDQFTASLGPPEPTQLVTRTRPVQAAVRGQLPLTFPLLAPQPAQARGLLVDGPSP